MASKKLKSISQSTQDEISSQKGALTLEIVDSKFGQMFTDERARVYFCELVASFAIEETLFIFENNQQVRLVKGDDCVFVYLNQDSNFLLKLDSRLPLAGWSQIYCQQNTSNMVLFKSLGGIEFAFGLNVPVTIVHKDVVRVVLNAKANIAAQCLFQLNKWLKVKS